jgi:hypothetical protein
MARPPDCRLADDVAAANAGLSQTTKDQTSKKIRSEKLGSFCKSGLFSSTGMHVAQSRRDQPPGVRWTRVIEGGRKGGRG